MKLYRNLAVAALMAALALVVEVWTPMTAGPDRVTVTPGSTPP